MSSSTEQIGGKKLGDQQRSTSRLRNHFSLQIKKPLPKGINFSKFQANGNLECRPSSATMQKIDAQD